MAVTVALGPRDAIKPPEREMIARQQVFALGGVNVDAAGDPVAITIGGLPAIELAARGVTSAGQQRRVHFVVVFGPKQVYTIAAIARPSRFDSAMADVRALVQSFRPK